MTLLYAHSNWQRTVVEKVLGWNNQSIAVSVVYGKLLPTRKHHNYDIHVGTEWLQENLSQEQFVQFIADRVSGRINVTEGEDCQWMQKA